MARAHMSNCCSIDRHHHRIAAFNDATAIRMMLTTTVITIITLLINDTSCRSLYTGCTNPGHFCMGSKSPNKDQRGNHGAVRDGGCIKNRDCNVIVHGTRYASGPVIWEIGQVKDSWTYLLFAKRNAKIYFWNNGVPQGHVMMETKYIESLPPPKAETSMGVESDTIVQPSGGYGYGAIDLSFDDDLSKVKPLYLFTFNTTITPPGLNLNFETDLLVPLLMRWHCWSINHNLRDQATAAAQNIFVGADPGAVPTAKPSVPIAPTAPMGNITTVAPVEEKEEKKAFPWWWILLALILLLLLLLCIIFFCCCRKKKEEEKDPQVISATPSARSTFADGAVSSTSMRSAMPSNAPSAAPSSATQRSTLPSSAALSQAPGKSMASSQTPDRSTMPSKLTSSVGGGPSSTPSKAGSSAVKSSTPSKKLWTPRSSMPTQSSVVPKSSAVGKNSNLSVIKHTASSPGSSKKMSSYVSKK